MRGQPPVNHEALVDLLETVSELIESYPRILEMDLNPSGDRPRRRPDGNRRADPSQEEPRKNPITAVCIPLLKFSTIIDKMEAIMPVSVKNPEVERLISEVAALTGETKTEAIRKSLEERRERLRYLIANEDRAARISRFLTQELWPILPEQEVGRRLSREEEESLLGYGKEGV